MVSLLLEFLQAPLWEGGRGGATPDFEPLFQSTTPNKKKLTSDYHLFTVN
jgi:hypothetical protein